jgi:hypothetical protein
MGKYGVKSKQAKVLMEIEESIGQKLPKINESIFNYSTSTLQRNKSSFGIQIYGDSVVGLLLNPLSSKRGYESPLTSLPESIGNLESLRELKITYNKLTTLPDSIGNLQYLQKLDLHNNEITTLPKSIGKLNSLELLNLEHNKLMSLPESIGDLQSLRELKLSNNMLTLLPESIINLKSLQKFDFASNRFVGEWTEIPRSSINEAYASKLFRSIRKLYGLNVFISHAWVDQEKYNILELNRFLENKLDITHDIFLCETDVIDDIWDFMTENVPKSHLLLFIATSNSIASVACRYELFLAKKFNIEILPIKGNDINWENLTRIQLMNRESQPQGFLDISYLKEKFEFDGTNYNEIRNKLSDYLISHESELKQSKVTTEGLENTKKDILNIINSDEFRELIKLNIEDVEQIFQKLSIEQISNSGYYSKLGEIILGKWMKNIS